MFQKTKHGGSNQKSSGQSQKDQSGVYKTFKYFFMMGTHRGGTPMEY